MARRKIDQLKDDVLRQVGPLLESWGSGGTYELSLAVCIDRLASAWDKLQTHIIPIIDTPGEYVEGSPETSRNAALAFTPASGSVRRRILDEIWSTSFYGYVGLTDEVLEHRLKCKHQTLSSARNFLVQAGWLVDSGKRAASTTTKRPQVVWSLSPAALAVLRGEASNGPA